jgi:hypothetical protein
MSHTVVTQLQNYSIRIYATPALGMLGATSREQPPIEDYRHMTVEPVTVDQPPYPIHALATFELAGYRSQLERAIAYFDAKNPVSSTRDDLQARLDAVIAEEDARAKINRL